MKKSLFALAALGAFASAAQAQSSVTLFGTIDAGVQYISNGGVAGSTTTVGSSAGASTQSATNATLAGPNTGNALTYYDSAIASSQWGMRGTEDLGGGMKTNFYFAGDANTNNGGSNVEGIFRRGAWVGVSNAKLGELRLGTQSNPIAASSSQLMPMMGNTAHGVRTAVGYSVKDYNRNAIGYITPVINGLQLEAQFAPNNTIDGGFAAGSASNLRAFYSQGNIDINAAYQQRRSMSDVGNAAQCGITTTVAGAAPLIGVGSTSLTCAAANYGGAVDGYVAGIKYKATPALQLGFAYGHADGDNTRYQAGLNTLASSSTAAKRFNNSVFMFGAAYQAAPAIRVGGSFMTTAYAQQYNFQTHYMLSKRTTAYFQVNSVHNGSATLTGSTTAQGNFGILGGQTGTSPSVQVQGMAALPNTNQMATGVGLIHSF